MPDAARNRFSEIRSWVVVTAAADGLTGT